MTARNLFSRKRQPRKSHLVLNYPGCYNVRDVSANSHSVPIQIKEKFYLATRDTTVQHGELASDYQQFGYGSYELLIRFIITELNRPDKYLGCINFGRTHISKFSWNSKNGDSMYGRNDNLDYSLANLIPYLGLDFDNVYDQFEKSSACITCMFDSNTDRSKYVNKLKRYYAIKKTGDIFETARDIMFRGKEPTSDEVQKTVLKVLRNYRQEYPTTKMLIPNLYSSVPATNKELLSALSYLEEEEQVEILYSPGNKEIMVSTKITTKGMKELNKPEKIYRPKVIKDKKFPRSDGGIKQGNVFVMGNLNQTTGDNSPITTITAGDINTIFEQAKKEIENRDPDEKKEMVKTLNELKNAVLAGDLNKTKEKYGKLKALGGWIANVLGNFIANVAAAAVTR